jgi:hypothetical protein
LRQTPPNQVAPNWIKCHQTKPSWSKCHQTKLVLIGRSATKPSCA